MPAYSPASYHYHIKISQCKCKKSKHKQTNISQQLKWVLHVQCTYYWICWAETLFGVRKDGGWCSNRRPVALMSLFFHSSRPYCRSLYSRKQLYQQHCLPHHFPCLCLLMPSSTSSSDLLYNGQTFNDIHRFWRHLLRKLVSGRLPKHHNVMSNEQAHPKLHECTCKNSTEYCPGHPCLLVLHLLV